MTRRPAIVALTVAAVLVLSPRLGRATVIIPMSDPDLVASSDLIVTGTVGPITSVLLDGRRIVTRITLAVDEVLKGRPGAETIVITEAGGQVGGRVVVVLGAPEYATGERVLVFLRRAADGSLETNGMTLGKYRLETAVARRSGPARDERPLAAFTSRVTALAAGQAGAATDGRAGVAVAPADLEASTDAFTFNTGSEGIAARWFEADCGLPILFSRANSDADFPPEVSQTALSDTTAAWTAVDGASIQLGVGPDASPTPSLVGGTFDGRSIVQFNDPFDEVPDLVNCSGVVARGGFAGSADADFGLRRDVNGRTFGKIFEGDVTMNNGTGACLQSAVGLAEVLAHEVGHAIGFGHSSEDPDEANPVLKDALMYFSVHNDGRGASPRADDIAGLQTMYPDAIVVTAPIPGLACELGLGILNNACFGERLALGPFNAFARARKAAEKAAAATVAKKQKKLVRKTGRLLAKADRSVARHIGGTCGSGMRATIAHLRERTAAILATL